MAGQSINLSEVFSDDISYMSDLETFDSLVEIKSVLQYYDDDEKLGYINSERKELIKKLAESVYKIAIPLKDIENDLNGSLETYYKKLSISHCTIVEFSNSLTEGKHKHSRREGKLIVSRLNFVEGDEPNFSFAFLDAFKPLVQYIGWSIWFLELKKLTDELKEGKIVGQEKEPPEINFYADNYGEEFRNEISNEILFPTIKPSLPKKYFLMFKEGAYELFSYLTTEYVSDDKSPKAKYSNIYRFLKNEELITCTQLEYIDFVGWITDVSMSKILPENDKYLDTIQPKLGRLKCDFEKERKVK